MEKKRILVELEVTDKGYDDVMRCLHVWDARCELGNGDAVITKLYMKGYGFNDVIDDLKSSICDKLEHLKDNV